MILYIKLDAELCAIQRPRSTSRRTATVASTMPSAAPRHRLSSTHKTRSVLSDLETRAWCSMCTSTELTTASKSSEMYAEQLVARRNAVTDELVFHPGNIANYVYNAAFLCRVAASENDLAFDLKR